jgi:hypothetical protein
MNSGNICKTSSNAHASGDFTPTIAENILMDAKNIVMGWKNHLMPAKNALTIYACALTDVKLHLTDAIRQGANETRQDTADENQDKRGKGEGDFVPRRAIATSPTKAPASGRTPNAGARLVAPKHREAHGVRPLAGALSVRAAKDGIEPSTPAPPKNKKKGGVFGRGVL